MTINFEQTAVGCIRPIFWLGLTKEAEIDIENYSACSYCYCYMQCSKLLWLNGHCDSLYRLLDNAEKRELQLGEMAVSESIVTINFQHPFQSIKDVSADINANINTVL